MKYAGPITMHATSPAPAAFGRPARRKNLFKRILAAMRASRRRQARNIIRRYRDLLADDPWDQPASAFPDLSTRKEDSANANADQTSVRTGSQIKRG